jgi:uncharacterized delta-60 repeat protein
MCKQQRNDWIETCKRLGALGMAAFVLLIFSAQLPAQSAGVFGFSAGDYQVSENESNAAGGRLINPDSHFLRNAPGALITVVRTGGAHGRIMVDYRTVDTNAIATAGANYVSTAGTLVFNHLQMSASFVVPVLADSVPMGNLSVPLELSNARPADDEDPDLDPQIGLADANLTILDQDAGFNFERSYFRVTEGIGTLSVRVFAPLGTNNISVQYEVRSSGAGFIAGSRGATAGQDFVAASGTLSWTGNQNRTRNPATITIEIRDDELVEFNEDFEVILRNASGKDDADEDVLLGGVFQAVVTILYEEDPAGALDREHNPDWVGNSEPGRPPYNLMPGANNTVYAVAVQPDGRAVLGGDFTAYNTIPRNRIARVLTSGANDATFNPGSGADGFITSVLIYTNGPNAGKMLIGGGFTSFNGIQRYGIARLNPDGSLDTGFNPGLGANGFVWSLAIQRDQKIVVGGDFTSFNGVQANSIVRLNPNGAVDGAFDASAGPNGPVYAVALLPNPGTPLTLSRTGTGTNQFTTNFNTGASFGSVTLTYSFGTNTNSIRVSYAGTVLYDSGSIVGGTNAVASFAYGPGISNELQFQVSNGATNSTWQFTAQILAGGTETITVGGDFTDVNGIWRNSIAQLNPNGSIAQGFNPGTGANGPVYALALQPNGRVIIGGAFTDVDLLSRNSIARLMPDGSLDQSFDPGTGANEAIYAMKLQSDGRILIGGLFTEYSGTHRLGLARLHPQGYLDTGFLDTAYNQFAGLYKLRSVDQDNFVNAIALQADDMVLIGGSFRRVGGNISEIGRINFTLYPENDWSFHLRDDYRMRNNFARLLGDSTPGPGNFGYESPVYTGDEGSGLLSFSVSREDGVLGFADLRFSTRDGSAVRGLDYQMFPLNTFQWDDGDPESYVYWIQLIDDNLIEGNETFHLLAEVIPHGLNLVGEPIPIGAALGRANALAIIADDDFPIGALGFSSPAYTVNENAGTATITVTRTNGSTGVVSVRYATTSVGTATPGADFTSVSGTLQFLSGQTSRTFTIPIINDTLVEPDETVTLVLSNPTGGAALGLAEAILTIIDDDHAAGRLSLLSETFTVSENAGMALITVVRSGGNSGEVAADVIATNGTAVAGIDFIASTNRLVWGDGDTAPKTVAITILNDEMVNPGKVVRILLENFSRALAGAFPAADLEIEDDDHYGEFSFTFPSYFGNENGTNILVGIARRNGASGTQTVEVFTADQLAEAGVDYVGVTNIVTFLPGQTKASVPIPVIDNSLADGNRNFTIELRVLDGGGTAVDPAVAEIIIIDDESVNQPAGALDTTFNTGIGPNSFVHSVAALPNGKIMAAGAFTSFNNVLRNRIIRLNANGSVDPAFRPEGGANDTIRAVLVQPDGRTLIGGFFTTFNGVNLNRIARLGDDGTVDTSFNPGAGADNPVYALALQRDGKVLLAGTFASLNGVSANGIGRLLPNGQVDSSFKSGSGANQAIYTVAVLPDGKILIGGEFTAFNGVPRSRLARLNPDGSLDASFTVEADGPVFSILVQDDGKMVVGGLFTEIDGAEFNRLVRLNSDGTIDSSFIPGEGANGGVLAMLQQHDGKLIVAGEFTQFGGVNQRRVTRLNEDGSVDPSINFGFGANSFIGAVALQTDLENAGRILLGGGFTMFNGQEKKYLVRIHGGSIAGSGSLEFSSPSVEAIENDGEAILSVRRVGGTAGAVSVQYSTVAESARPGIDYVESSGVIQFAHGETFRLIAIPLIDNNQVDGDRTFRVLLHDSVGAALGSQPTAGVTIIEDDTLIEFSASNYSVNESTTSGGAVITVLRSGAMHNTVSVRFSTANGTAIAGLDYMTTILNLTFGPGVTQRTFMVPVIDDGLVELNETVNLQLSNPSQGAFLGRSTAILTIVSDDFAFGTVAFAAPAFFANESDGVAAINLVRTNGTTGAISVRVTTADGTAIAGQDYQPVAQTVIFNEGEAAQTVFIPLIDDAIPEGAKTVFVTLSDATGGADLAEPVTVTLSIEDDDFGPGSLDPSFEVGLGADTLVRALAVQPDGKVLMGGAFTNVNGFARNFVARLNADGAVDAGFNPGIGPNGLVFSLGLDSSGKVVIGGAFTSVNNISRNRVALLHGNGAIDLGMNGSSGINAAVFSVLPLTNGNFYVGGGFTTPLPRFLKIRPNGSSDTSFATGTGVNGPVYSIAQQPDHKVVIGGDFTQVNQISRSGVARLRTDGSVDPNFVPPSLNGIVYGVAVDSEGRVVLAGTFQSINGLMRNRVARLNSDGSLDESFNPGTGANDTIFAMLVQPDNKVVIGGDFTAVDGRERNRFARLNADGSLDLTFDPGIGADDSVYALALLPDGKIIIGGEFEFVNGFRRPGVARINGDESTELRIEPGAGFADGEFRFEIISQAGRQYALDASDDLINWTPLSTNTAVGVTLEFTDPGAAGLDRRFYRVRQVNP